MEWNGPERYPDNRNFCPWPAENNNYGWGPGPGTGPYQYDQTNVEPPDFYGCQPPPFTGRKRAFHQPSRVPSSEHVDGGVIPAKLFVAPVPRSATEQDVRLLFEPHGSIVEVVFPRDKFSNQRHAYCFIKYMTFEDASRAINALHNQYTFPGEHSSIRVKFAAGERDRHCVPSVPKPVPTPIPVSIPHKLYVARLCKEASKKEIEEIFSQYGLVEDIYILCDELKQRRGSAFVQFSCRDMALAAINGLNGNFTMRGCDMPLIVRFAEPKKPRIGEPRGNCFFGNPSFGFNNQEPPRLAPNHVEMLGGCVSSAPYSLPPLLVESQPQVISHWTNPGTTAPDVSQQLHSSQQQSSSQLTLVVKSPKEGSTQKNSDGTSIASLTEPQSFDTEDLECDWSEHTCPDGDKYYYNCVTCESKWDKPEEYVLYERLLQKQQTSPNVNQQGSCQPEILCSEKVNQSEDGQLQPQLSDENLLVPPSLSAPDPDCLQVNSEASPIADPTCVS